MRFKTLYSNNKQAVRETLESMWCADLSQQKGNNNSQQQNQADLISKKIDEVFAPETSMPVVEYAETYIQVPNNDIQTAKQLVNDANGVSLWNRHDTDPNQPIIPFQHQHDCWKHLTETVNIPQANGGNIQAVKSIVVTTGTGSGKTECFMLPLVSDLLRRGHTGQLQAIFLYPLNALMEDQKERLQKLLNDTNLTFSVYNGNLPEEVTDDNSREIDEELGRYANILPTRKFMRGQNDDPNNQLTNMNHRGVRADIILTNPTMLEYMMLRPADTPLINNADLRWIVIDETHTYTGAGAIEMSMLMKRVLKAFNKTPYQVRFATSSATIGNSQNPATVLANDEKLRQFIADLAGQDRSQVEIVKGNRKNPQTDAGILARINNDNELAEAYNRLYAQNYVKLDELDDVYATSPGNTIEKKLEALDSLCDRGLRVKVHFFHRALNGGIRTRLDNIDPQHGTFPIYTEEPFNSNMPYLELSRCSCGHYLAIGEEYQDAQGRDYFRKKLSVVDDIFLDNANDNAKTKVYGLLNGNYYLNNGNVPIQINGNTFNTITPQGNNYVVVKNDACCCPYCGKSLLPKQSDNSPVNAGNEEVDDEKITSFRVSTAFTARMIAPSVLDEMQENNDNGIPIDFPHKGQQFISFVDSRQGAARATLDQLKEEEKLWINSKIFHRLNELSFQGQPAQLSWMAIFDLLFNDGDKINYFYRHASCTELNNNGNPDENKIKYVLALIYDNIAKRPIKAFSPENLGLFVSCYPDLEQITNVPQTVLTILPNLHLQEWKNLLKIYLDRHIRANEIFFFDKNIQYNNYDIAHFKKFAIERHNNRPAHKEINFPANRNYGIILMLIAAAIWENEGNNGNISKQDINNIVGNHQQDIITIANAVWEDLVNVGLLEQSRHYDRARQVPDDGNCRDAQGNLITARMNLTNLSFKLYDQVYFCNTSRSGNQECYRPYDTLFLGYSPYRVSDGLIKVDNQHTETWAPYPYVYGLNNGQRVTCNDVEIWANEARRLLYDFHLWGRYGSFSNRLTKIFQYPELFIQAEDTAQVDKKVVNKNRQLFKSHKINIMACSTTMEMGVDLGSLDLVMMNSVPPMPSNFKQRAGRSGRRGQNRSASITLCGSDSIGLRTLYNPLDNLILRETAIPFVDTNCQTVIQRHVNAFLLREFLNVGNTNLANVINYNLLDFCKNENNNYTIDKPTHGIYSYRVCENQNGAIIPIHPDVEMMSNFTNSRFAAFRDFLNNVNTGNNTQIVTELTNLIANTNLNIDTAKSDAVTLLNNLLNKLAAQLSDIEQGCLQLRQNATRQQLNNLFNNKIYSDYAALLDNNLLKFLATNRFIPNANMPTEIIEFGVNDEYDRRKNNPSYTLREALSQYAPGNNVVLSNNVRIVRGLKYTSLYSQVNNSKYIFKLNSDVRVQDNQQNPFNQNPDIWNVNNQNYLELIEPTKFIPDVNEDSSRTQEKCPYTKVSAQLIGAKAWQPNTQHLYDLRTNAYSPDAKILYYNEGTGYGYCVCKKCGRVALETSPANIQGTVAKLPSEMISEDKMVSGKIQLDQNGNPIKTHKKLSYKGKQCDTTSYHRNVIIGSQIQTDYADIKIFNTNNQNVSIEILNTLGIAFCKMLTEHLGKEAKDVDFLITPDHHLCIFDTNPGGSGYANQLERNDLFDIIVDNSERFLYNAQQNNRKDEILDKFTIRYADSIDIDGAIDWLHDEQTIRPNPPQSVLIDFPNSHKVRLQDLVNACQNGIVDLFFLDNSDRWSYQDATNQNIDWLLRGNLLNLGITNPKRFNFNIVCSANIVPSFEQPIYNILQNIEGWANINHLNNPLPSGYYPIAIAQNCLYFTDCKLFASLNVDWASESKLYSIDLQALGYTIPQPTPLNVHPNNANMCKFEIASNEHTNIQSNDLANIVYNYNEQGQGLINQFLEHCQNNPNEIIRVSYQDEHLKSPCGIAATAQFIESLASMFGNEYKLDIYVEEYYDNNDNIGEIGNNIDYDNRNNLIEELYENWQNYSKLLVDWNLHNLKKKSLPHWRVLKFKCGNKQLKIYPNGGIINEWMLDRYSNITIPTYYNIDWNSIIPLYHRQPIMYDITLI